MLGHQVGIAKTGALAQCATGAVRGDRLHDPVEADVP
jgi:hypothetical protein